MKATFTRCSLFMVVCQLLLISQAAAQSRVRKVDLPTNPAQWINSPPLTQEMLAGKAVVFWFFEEQCPRCAGKWPDILSTAKEYDGKPVLFVGVNSGNDRQTVEDYLRRHNVTWPVIVDPDRSFEKQADVGEISLQNIYASCILYADGRFVRDGLDVAVAAAKASATAKWKIDPAGIPSALKTSWQQIEFGQFASAAPQIKKGLNAQNAEQKAAAEKLNAVVLADMTKTIDEAKKANDAGRKWTAYKGFTSTQTKFKGYEIPAEVAATTKELAASDDVKKELAASKMLDSIRVASAKADTPSKQKSVKGQLDRLIKQSPGTEAALEAQKLLEQ